MTDAVTTNLPVPGRALAIGAHPDDVEFGCGGTLAKWAAAGCVINHVVLTDGSKGSWDPDEDVGILVATRREEQREASRALGGSGEVVFLGWPDGELQAGLRQRWELASWIRRLRPDVVLGHDPWKRYRLHPDHRAAGFLLTDAIVAARDPHFFPEQRLEHHRPTALLLWEADEPDHVEDASGYADAKLAAILEHRSQFRSTMDIDDPDADEAVERFRGRILRRLREHGHLAGLDVAEAFKLIDRLRPLGLLGAGLLRRSLLRRRLLGGSLLGRGRGGGLRRTGLLTRSLLGRVRGSGLLGGSAGGPATAAQVDPRFLQHVVHETVRAARVVGDLADALPTGVPLGVLGAQRRPLGPTDP